MRLLGTVSDLLGWMMLELPGATPVLKTGYELVLVMTTVLLGLTVLLTEYPFVVVALLEGVGVETGYPPPFAVEEDAALLEPATHLTLSIPNCVLYWYWPVMSSMSWMP
jgi:hypothetical protein